jgi:outer membrane protein assembly factor BamB
MRPRTLSVLVVAIGLALLGSRWPELATGGVSDIGQAPFYAQTSWASTHRDSRNSDFAPFVAPDLDPSADQTRWTALGGAVTLLAPAIGPEGNRYITTGRGPGTSHLHAFDADGNLLWESAPQQSLADLDSQAVGSSPLVDEAGHVYVSDGNQFWSFRADGRVRWVAPLPPPENPLDPGAGFISSILANEGYVGGITTDGKVILFRRENGKLAVPIFELPQGVPPPGIDLPGLWAGGLMDPAIRRFVEDWFFGNETQVANTPSVHPETGRIYITAAGPLDPGTSDLTGLLYGLDIADGEMEIAFAASMGGGSGTSPTISLDGTQVYAADNLGVLRAFDADTGAVVWSQTGIPLAGSPGLGADGTIYGGNSDPGATSTLVALDPADGAIRWAQDYDAFAASLLPPLPVHLLPPPLQVFFPNPQPIARVNSVVSSSARKAWVALTVGYQFLNPLSGISLSQPRLTVLASIDPGDGSILGYSELRDTQEGLISIGPDGTVHVSLGSILGTINFFGINPLLESFGLGPPFLYPGTPVGGVQVLESLSSLDLAIDGIDWVQELVAVALAELAGGSLETAFTATRRGRVQLLATVDSIDDAEADGELDGATAASARGMVNDAERLLTSARNLLGQGAVPPPVVAVAAQKIEAADVLLDEALDALAP